MSRYEGQENMVQVDVETNSEDGAWFDDRDNFITMWNQGGFDKCSIDVVGLIKWIKDNRPLLLDDVADMDIQAGGPSMTAEEVNALLEKNAGNRPILGPIVYGECPEEDTSYRYIDDKRDDPNMTGIRVTPMGRQEYHWLVWVPGSSVVLDQDTAWSLADAWRDAEKVAKKAYRTE